MTELGRVPGDSGHFSDLDRHPENVRVEGIRVLRIEGGLFFANAAPLSAAVRSAVQRDDVHTVVIDAETMPFIDVTGARYLDQLARELEANGVRVLIARNIGQVRDVIHAAPGASILDSAYPTVAEAVGEATAGRR